MIGECQPSVDSVYLDLLRGKLEMVWSDNSHPLHGQLRSQVIPRCSGRLGLPYTGTNRHPASFIPKAIKLYNGNNVMLADNVRPLNWEDSLHYHCYV